MFIQSILFLMGVCAPILFSNLVQSLYLLAVLLFLVVCRALLRAKLKAHRKKFNFTSICLVVFGFVWMSLFAHWQLRWELPKHIEKKPIQVQAEIVSLPQTRGRALHFNAYIKKFHSKVSLSWYKPYPKISVGQVWHLTVKLKRPHGLSNPGGFDFERSDFFKGIRAKGYVYKGDNKLVSNHWYHQPINRVRSWLDSRIKHALGDNALVGIIRAVTVGDKSGISQSQWQVFQKTGTSHLMAISGLHIGLIAGFAFAIFGFVWRGIPFLCLRFAAVRAGAIAAIVAAVLYAALAGFGVPTQRAVIMLVVFMGAIIVKRKLQSWRAWSVSLFLVLMINPLNVLSPGFWLSFLAVASLIYGFSGRLAPSGLWWKYGRAQWVVMLGLLPVTLFIFQRASLFAPLANVVAIPWVGFVTVPIALLGCIFSFIPTLSTLLLKVSLWSMQVIWPLLQWLSTLPSVAWQHAVTSVFAMVLACIGVVWLLAPRGFPSRWLGIFLLFPLIFSKNPKPGEGNFWFTLLDVGQGLSVVVQTHHHLLIFDTGAKYAPGFDMGGVVITPYLHSIGISTVDNMVISHGDNDHIGGAQTVLQNFAVKSISTSVPKRFPHFPATLCLAGQHWRWDGVSFEFLSPVKSQLGQGNNSSCVLKVSNDKHSVLFTGDIEKPTEQYLVQHERKALQSEILVAPHHGSKTSSSLGFIKAVNPKIVLFPTGYLNRFHFPSASVVNRYRALGIRMYNTAEDGAIIFKLSKSSSSDNPNLYRDVSRRFWSG